MDTLRVGGVPEHFNLPWHLAIENGFFEKKNIDLAWITCKGGTGEMCHMLEDKQLDLAVLLTEGAVKHIIEKRKTKILQLFVQTPLVWGLHVPYQCEIQHYSEVFDAPIAISRFGSGSHLMPQVDAYFKKQQIAESQWKVVHNLDGAIELAQENKEMVFYWEKFTTKPYVDQEIFRRVGEFITPWPCFVIAVNKESYQKNKQQIDEIGKIVCYTASQLMEATNALEMFEDRYNMPPIDAHDWFYMTEWAVTNEVSPKMLENAMQILKECGVIRHKVKVEELVVSEK